MKPLLSAVSAAAVLCASSAFAMTPPGGGGGGGGGGSSDCTGSTVRGPAPTTSSLQNEGPYSTRTDDISSRVSGFGGGTIHYPVGAGDCMAAIVVIPPYTGPESTISFYGPRLASWGFVVLTMATESLYDFPDSRANQADAALDYLIGESEDSSSPISGLVDSDRIGAVGWSMGGGASLRLSTLRDLDGAFIQAPWYGGSSTFVRSIDTPFAIYGMENDTVAPVEDHALEFYIDMPSSTSKLYLEFNNASHFFVDEDTFNEVGVAWMKSTLDNDSRFEPFTCATNYAARFDIREQRNNCQF